MSPRSILKQSEASSSSSFASELPYPYPTVHFPPTPTLTQSFPTHSASAYDRHPIVVVPNDCALPGRGCRKYDDRRESPVRKTVNMTDGGYFHPRAQDEPHARLHSGHDRMTASFAHRPIPPLVPDLSSSDESDGVVSPPPEAVGPVPLSLHFPHSTPSSKAQLDKALSFLPHPPSPTKDKERKRKPRAAEHKFKSESGTSAFAASSLDGCLGGF